MRALLRFLGLGDAEDHGDGSVTPPSGAATVIGPGITVTPLVRPFLDAPNKVHPGARRAFEEAGLWPPQKVLGKK